MGKRSIAALNNNDDGGIKKYEKTESYNSDCASSSSLIITSSSTTSTALTTSSSSSSSSSSLSSSSSSTLSLLSSGGLITDDEEIDVDHPSRMHLNVALIIEKWGSVTAIPPAEFLSKLLSKRGYSSKNISALDSPHRRIPTEKQLLDYDIELVNAIRSSDLECVKKLRDVGKCMSACNTFSESIVHMACRRSEYNLVEYLLENGGDVQIVDDYGRTPLHDACWRPEPRFDIVTLLLDRNSSLLQLVDIRGATPLNYVREDDWLQWCAYIFYQKERYWGINDSR